jgi:hypothetical protein
MSNSRSELGAQVRPLNGVPTLFVNGVPQGPMSFQWGFGRSAEEEDPKKRAQMSAAGRAGIAVHFIRIDWSDPAHLDEVLATFDGYVHEVLQAIPEAYIMPWITIWPYTQYALKHPDDVIVFDDGRTGPWTNPKFMRLENPDTPRYTWASLAWRRENSDLIARFVKHIDEVPYRDHIVGYFFFPQCFETSYFWDWDYQNRSIDYSPAMRNYFRRWLREAYGGDVQALRRAWRDDAVTFNTAELPTIAQKNHADLGFFWDPDKSRPAMDYFRAHNEAIEDTIIHYARVVKRESARQVVCGFFYGYIHQMPYSGHSTFKKVLACPEIDIWASPHIYENRGPGDHAMFRFLNKTLKDHGRLWYAECDTFMHDTNAASLRHHGYPLTTFEQTREVLKREFAYTLCEGAQGWWVDWAEGDSLYEEPLISLLQRMQRIARASLQFPRRSATDIAVVLDQESLLATPPHGWRDLTRRLVNTARVAELPRLGTPVDYLELDDALRDDATPYRLYIMLNPYLLDSDERQRIAQQLKRNGNTLVWLYAPGLSNPQAHPAQGLAHMEELVGMRLGCIPQRLPARLRITDRQHPFTADLPLSEFGDYERPITTGFEMNRDTMEPWLLPPMEVYPLFYVDDSAATVLGRYLHGEQPAFAVRRFADWTSVYIGSPAPNAAVLRAIAHASGVHQYVQGDDIVYANQSMIAIHTREAGPRTIRLRRPGDAYEAFDDLLLARGVTEFTLDIPATTTRLIFTGDVSAFRAALR